MKWSRQRLAGRTGVCLHPALPSSPSVKFGEPCRRWIDLLADATSESAAAAADATRRHRISLQLTILVCIEPLVLDANDLLNDGC